MNVARAHHVVSGNRVIGSWPPHLVALNGASRLQGSIRCQSTASGGIKPWLAKKLHQAAEQQTASPPDEAAPAPPTPPQQASIPKAMQCMTPEEIEKEKDRRARISAANSGKEPWNKGRKHSPETIAKIRERTRAAMQRPDVVQAYKEGVAKHMQKRAEEKALHPPPEKPPKPPSARRKKASAEGEQGQEGSEGPKITRRSRKTSAAADAGGEGQEGAEADITPKRTRRRSKATEEGEPATPKERKKRAPPSEEHKAAIAAAIRAKWQDPTYRQKAVQGIHAYITEKTGVQPIPGVKRRSKSKSSSGSSSTSTTSSSKADRQAREARLAQVEELVSQVVNCRKLIARMELNMEGTRHKASAFLNDPRMAGRAAAIISESEQAMQVARQKLAQLEAQLPAGVTFDNRGKITSFNPEILFGSDTGSDTAAAESVAARDTARDNSPLRQLDPLVMQSPLQTAPDGVFVNGQGHVNGSHANKVNGVQVNGVNGHGKPHVNGHAVHIVSGASGTHHLTASPSAQELLTPRTAHAGQQPQTSSEQASGGGVQGPGTVIELQPPSTADHHAGTSGTAPARLPQASSSSSNQGVGSAGSSGSAAVSHQGQHVLTPAAQVQSMHSRDADSPGPVADTWAGGAGGELSGGDIIRSTRSRAVRGGRKSERPSR